MEVEQLTVPKREAKKQLEELKAAIKKEHLSKKDRMTKDFLKVYGHLQHGGKVIDLHETFRKTGVRRKDNFPKLAIVVADSQYCYCFKRPNGRAIFSGRNKERWSVHQVKSYGDIEVPKGTFKWKLKKVDGVEITKTDWINDYEEPHNARCVAPIIPAQILVNHVKALLPNYHILFEAESWEKIPLPPRDPILGRMLTPNIFGVLATWDLTPLERAIIKGRL